MKETKTQSFYDSPRVEVVDIKAREMLCASTQINFGINNEAGYEETVW